MTEERFNKAVDLQKSIKELEEHLEFLKKLRDKDIDIAIGERSFGTTTAGIFLNRAELLMIIDAYKKELVRLKDKFNML